MEVHYRVVKVWEMDPAMALDVDRPTLLPWTLLMRPTRTQVRETARRLKRAGDASLIAQFLTLGGLNPDYGKFELLEFLEKEAMYLKREIIEASRFIQGLKQEFRKEARKEGREEGREEGMLDVLRAASSDRFPGIAILPLDLHGEELKLLVRRVLSAPNRRAAEAWLKKARRPVS